MVQGWGQNWLPLLKAVPSYLILGKQNQDNEQQVLETKRLLLDTLTAATPAMSSGAWPSQQTQSSGNFIQVGIITRSGPNSPVRREVRGLASSLIKQAVLETCKKQRSY